MNRCNVTNTTYQDGRSLDIAWNDRYEITSVSTNGTTLESYEYDALGRRVKIENAGSTNYLVYDGIHVVAEVNSSGELQKSYTWAAGQRLLAWTDYTGGSTNTYYPLTDFNGTVHAVVDETGTNVLETYAYDGYGNVTVYTNGVEISESVIGNHYLFHGKWFSWRTGLFFNQARWYEPVTGRFLSKDPSGISGGQNQYEFCLSNPVNFIDEDGECAKESHAYWMDVAASGHDTARESGFWGKVGGYSKAAGASIMTSFIDFWRTRTLQNNAELSGKYSTSEDCQGKAWKHGGLAVGQIALSATMAFGGNNAAHPWYRYVGPKSLPTYAASGRVASGAWVVRGPAFGRRFVDAKNFLQMPHRPTDLIRVKGAWRQFIKYRGRAINKPGWGTGGAHQWQVH